MPIPIWGLAAAILLNGCLTRPEPRIPDLPALPVTSVEVAELPPLAGPSSHVEALLQVLPYRPDATWYDELNGPRLRLAQEGEALAPVPALLDAIGDSDPAIRRGASFVIAAMSNRFWREQPAGLAPALISAADDEDALVRENALRATAVVQPFGSVEPMLIAALDDPEPRVRWAAARTLSPWQISDLALPALADALDDSDIRVRFAAAFILGFHEDGPALVLPDILRRLRDADPDVRIRAAEQVQFFSDSIDDAALPSVIAMLNDEDLWIRRYGATTLGATIHHRRPVGSEASALDGVLIDSLSAALADDDAEVRASAARGLRSLGQRASSARVALARALETESNAKARLAVRQALYRIGGGGSGILLSDLPTWSDPQLCIDSAEFSIGGLRSWDNEQRAWVALGTPDSIAGGWSEDDGGPAPIYHLQYPGMQVDVFRDRVEKLTTTSETVSIGRRIHVGMTRDEVLAIEFEIEPSPGALAARRFEIPDCELPFARSTVLLDFDEDGRLWRAEMHHFAP